MMASYKQTITIASLQIVALILLSSQFQLGQSLFVTKCQYQNLTISCPSDSYINIRYAMYGRLSKTICNANGSQSIADSSCSLKNATKIAREECQGNTSCTLTVDTAQFPDPCAGTNKYLEIDFVCVKTTIKVQECQFKDVYLSCPFGGAIKVLDAMYGRQDATTCDVCPQCKHNTTCKSSNSLKVTRNLCDDLSFCKISICPAVFDDDPCLGTFKYFYATYMCIFELTQEGKCTN